MKTKLTFLILFFSCYLSAQTVFNITYPTSGNYTVLNAGDTYLDNADLKFKSNKFSNRYLPFFESVGLHFKNGETTTISCKIFGDNSSIYSSPVLGVWGNNTVLRVNGQFLESGCTETYPVLVLRNGGKFIFTSNAYVDIILDSYFTRQIWTYGDGTGVFEIEENFIADRTAFATTPIGCGSLRFSNTTFITHKTESLPMGYRPNTSTGIANVNSHLVFENEGGSVWRIMTNDQTYKGGLWLDADMTIETIKNLTINGVKTTTIYSNGGTYDNWGGVMIRKVNKIPHTLTKKGAAKLILSGDHGYDTNSKFSIQEGTVELQSDPFTYTDNKGYTIDYKNETITKANLDIEIKNTGKLYVNTSLARIDSIGLTSTGTLDIGLHNTLITNKAVFNGTLNVIIPSGLLLKTGDSFNLFDFTAHTGNFVTLNIPNYGGAITWNTSNLYTNGTISITSGSIISTSEEIRVNEGKMILYPNPFNDKLIIQSTVNENLIIQLFSMDGSLVEEETVNDFQTVIKINNLNTGVYFYRILNKNSVIQAKGKLIKK